MAPPAPRNNGGLQTVGSYTLLETVGQGTFGEVMLAVERHTRESVAVKILEKEKIVDDDARQRLVNEIMIPQRVQHGKRQRRVVVPRLHRIERSLATRRRREHDAAVTQGAIEASPAFGAFKGIIEQLSGGAALQAHYNNYLE